MLVFSYEALENATTAYEKLKKKVSSLGTEEKQEGTEEMEEKFKDALSNDLNTSLAITILYDVLKSDLEDAQKRYLVHRFDEVLSLDLCKNIEETIDDSLKTLIEEKIEERNQAKKDKDYAKADAIREELLAHGVVIKDTREGTVYEVK